MSERASSTVTEAPWQSLHPPVPARLGSRPHHPGRGRNPRV